MFALYFGSLIFIVAGFTANNYISKYVDEQTSDRKKKDQNIAYYKYI